MLNHIVIMGRLTKDPELRRTGNGTAVTSFTVACDRDFGKEEKETDFIECVAWKNTAEFVSKHFSKGRMAVVSGRLQIRECTDKDGNKRRTAEILANNVYFGDSKKEAADNGYTGFVKNEPAAPEAPAQDFALLNDPDAQLPF
jgi:single-strand DNA-binding protein